MGFKKFEEIEGWQGARRLNQQVCALTRRGTSFDADPDLRRQMRKASVSVMANIAEGFDSGTDPEFIRFLKIARRSASEVQSHLYAALDEGFITDNQFQTLYEQAAMTKRLIGGLMVYLGWVKQVRKQPADAGSRHRSRLPNPSHGDSGLLPKDQGRP